MRFLIRRLAPLGVAVVALVAWAAPAHAQSAGDHITSFGVVVDVGAQTGDLTISESISYVFGPGTHHGIFRDIPTRLGYDRSHDRLYVLRNVSVSSEDAPHTFTTETGPGGTTRTKIGDPNQTVSGAHTYDLRYTISGALNAFPDHVELYWNAIGDQWPVPIDHLHVSVVGGANVVRATCFAGAHGSSLPCDRTDAAPGGSGVSFTQDHLDAFQAMTFVVAFPAGSVPVNGPILSERWSPARAFAMTPATVSSAGVLLIAVVGGLVLLVWRVGRDRRAVGSAVDAAFATAGAREERVPLVGRDEVPVQVEPPDGLRPGQIGTLVDERANPLDVTATIVDLAVRGHLRIEEIAKHGWLSKADWKLTRTPKTAAAALLPYEQLVLDGLFKDAHDGTVERSELKNKFATRLHQVEQSLYDDAIGRGWFAGRPDHVRQLWLAAGIVIAAIGGVLVVAAAANTHLGIVPIPIALGGLALALLSGRMPRRTATGTGVLVRALGFKRFIDDSEKDRARFAEQRHLFTEYLPYAIVFGATERWAKTFAGLDGALPDESSWYVSSQPFTFLAFSHSIDGFTTTSAGTIASTPSASGTSGFGGGFAGGGGGGGGGGSW